MIDRACHKTPGMRGELSPAIASGSPHPPAKPFQDLALLHRALDGLRAR
ncbi:hypothetical protein [Salinifilum ghardaiensis]